MENEIISKMIFLIPELKHEYEKNIEWWNFEFPGFHNIFGDVITPYLIENLSDSNKNKEILERIFDFFEYLIETKNPNVINALQVSILETIGDHEELLKISYNFMKPKTRILSDDIEQYLRRIT